MAASLAQWTHVPAWILGPRNPGPRVPCSSPNPFRVLGRAENRAEEKGGPALRKPSSCPPIPTRGKRAPTES